MKPESIPDVPRGVVRFYNFLPQGNYFLDDVLAQAGFAAQTVWTDAAQMYSIHGMIAV